MNSLQKRKATRLGALSLCTIMLSPAYAGDSLGDALRDGEFKFMFRLRHEVVDQQGVAQDANATSLLSRITYASKPWANLRFVTEADLVSHLGGERFNDTRNGKTQYPTVADPNGFEVNQVYIDWTGLADTTLRVGRQRINFDNQRFVGGVAWRQNEQTFDAVTLINKSLPDTTITLSHVNTVNRIFGPDNGTPDEDLESSTELLNVAYTGIPGATLSAYGYLIDTEDAPALSSKTYGVRLTGAKPLNEQWKFLYTAEYAQQRDHGDNTTDYKADFHDLEAGLAHGPWVAKLGYEVLEGSRSGAGMAFTTPLATGHKFLGFADRFLATPATGIEDRRATLVRKFGDKTKLMVTYHDFDSEATSRDYGKEWNAVLAHTVRKNVSAMVKFARYSGDDPSATDTLDNDTLKWWFMVTAKF